MFERYTDRARRVVVLAQDGARALNHNYIGVEHLLFGLTDEGGGVAAKALKSVGVTSGLVHDKIEVMTRVGTTAPSGHIPFAPESKKALEQAMKEALQLGHSYIGTEHQLLALIRESEGAAAALLKALSVDIHELRRAIIQEMSGFRAAPRQPVVPPQSQEPNPWVRTSDQVMHDIALHRARLNQLEEELGEAIKREAAATDDKI